MANHKSAEKRMRQTIRRTQRNSQTKSSVRTEEKKLRAAIEKNDKSTAETLLVSYSSKLGKAAQKGIYHANTASRKISRVAAQIHKM